MSKYRAVWQIRSLDFTAIDVWKIQKRCLWFWTTVTDISVDKGEAGKEKIRYTIKQIRNNESYIT